MGSSTIPPLRFSFTSVLAWWGCQHFPLVWAGPSPRESSRQHLPILFAYSSRISLLGFTSSFADGDAANQDQIAEMLDALGTAVLKISTENKSCPVRPSHWSWKAQGRKLLISIKCGKTSALLHISLFFPFDFRCECYDYLFDIAVQMKQHGLDPSKHPAGENGILWMATAFIFRCEFISRDDVFGGRDHRWHHLCFPSPLPLQLYLYLK